MNQNQTIDYFLKTGWQTIANKYNQIASQYGFTQAAGYILINIHKEGTPVSQIANLTGVKTTSLSRVLNNLESLGFIYRETSETDKPSVKLNWEGRNGELPKMLSVISISTWRIIFRKKIGIN